MTKARQPRKKREPKPKTCSTSEVCHKCGTQIGTYEPTVIDIDTGHVWCVECAPVERVGLNFDPVLAAIFKEYKRGKKVQ